MQKDKMMRDAFLWSAKRSRGLAHNDTLLALCHRASTSWSPKRQRNALELPGAPRSLPSAAATSSRASPASRRQRLS